MLKAEVHFYKFYAKGKCALAFISLFHKLPSISKVTPENDTSHRGLSPNELNFKEA